MKASVLHLNPEGLAKNPAFTQAVVVSGSVKLEAFRKVWGQRHE